MALWIAASLAVACAPRTWTRPSVGAREHERVFVAVRDTPILGVGSGRCADVAAQRSTRIIPAATTVVIDAHGPSWEAEGLTDHCRSLVPIHGVPELISLDDLARPGSPAFDALRTGATAAVVYGRGEPEHATVLGDGREIELAEGVGVSVIGRTGPAEGVPMMGTVAALEDGTVVWSPFLMITDDPSWRTARRVEDTCQALDRAWSGYPELPPIESLLASPDASRVFRMSVAERRLASVSAEDGEDHRYLVQSVTGSLLLRSSRALVGPLVMGLDPRRFLVRPTARVVDVGLVRALELEIVFSSVPCAFDAELADSLPPTAPVPPAPSSGGEMTTEPVATPEAPAQPERRIPCVYDRAEDRYRECHHMAAGRCVHFGAWCEP